MAAACLHRSWWTAPARLGPLAAHSLQHGTRPRERWGAFSCRRRSETEEQRAAARSMNEALLYPPLHRLYDSPSPTSPNCLLLSWMDTLQLSWRPRPDIWAASCAQREKEARCRVSHSMAFAYHRVNFVGCCVVSAFSQGGICSAVWRWFGRDNPWHRLLEAAVLLPSLLPPFTELLGPQNYHPALQRVKKVMPENQMKQ